MDVFQFHMLLKELPSRIITPVQQPIVAPGITCKYGNCGLVFNDLESFEKHLKDGELRGHELPGARTIKSRAYHCQWAGCTYKTELKSSSIINHVLRHTAVPQVCPHCRKRFSRKDTLRRHVENKHRGLEPAHPTGRARNVLTKRYQPY
ncbi:hypothetical protein CPB84DRAFT_128500 [Gymnopilus junonius]|uniref:C2H2-type domain-containing protein n=1 Tax=Gymnopilus junonius TaxID=109634 RepID=A0A9P5TIP2_GYMJU|nr:hypothetical protein CPB84DRAFT_128500 [Gymnopilus junonius]